MSYSLDVNVLVYAAFEDSPFHTKARAFLEDKLNGGERCFLCLEVIHGFLRLVTHPAVSAKPYSPREAVAAVESLEANPQVELLSSTPESLRILKEYLADLTLRGPVVSDAVVASVLAANGIKTIYTHDRDFWKFPFLKPIDPFAD